jgi:hypothetical protein
LKHVGLFAALLVFSFLSLASAVPLRIDLSSQLWGRWQFTGYIYGGEFQPPPNPNLVLTFEFLEDGTNILKWYRKNEKGFCERKGKYSYDGEKLSEEIVWVNPDNSFECWRDPDMMLGRKQITPIKREENHLKMVLPLADETLLYIWELQGSEKSQ